MLHKKEGEWFSPAPLGRLCQNLSLSLRTTEGSAAISLFPTDCEIASVVSLPRNDIPTHPPERGGKGNYKVY